MTATEMSREAREAEYEARAADTARMSICGGRYGERFAADSALAAFDAWAGRDKDSEDAWYNKGGRYQEARAQERILRDMIGGLTND